MSTGREHESSEYLHLERRWLFGGGRGDQHLDDRVQRPPKETYHSQALTMRQLDSLSTLCSRSCHPRGVVADKDGLEALLRQLTNVTEWVMVLRDLSKVLLRTYLHSPSRDIVASCLIVGMPTPCPWLSCAVYQVETRSHRRDGDVDLD